MGIWWREHPLICIRQKFSPTKHRYAAVERESLAIKLAIDELWNYLMSHPFTVITDHAQMSKVKDTNSKSSPLVFILTRVLVLAASLSKEHSMEMSHSLWLSSSLATDSGLTMGTTGASKTASLPAMVVLNRQLSTVVLAMQPCSSFTKTRPTNWTTIQKCFQIICWEFLAWWISEF